MFTFTPLSAEEGQLTSYSTPDIIILIMAVLVICLKCEQLFLCLMSLGCCLENAIVWFEHVGGRRGQKKGRRGRNGAAEPQGQS